MSNWLEYNIENGYSNALRAKSILLFTEVAVEDEYMKHVYNFSTL